MSPTKSHLHLCRNNIKQKQKKNAHIKLSDIDIESIKKKEHDAIDMTNKSAAKTFTTILENHSVIYPSSSFGHLKLNRNMIANGRHNKTKSRTERR